MSKDDHSKKLLNSIAEAFSANNQAKEVVGNPTAPAAEQTKALINATRALNNVTREATSPENLNAIMTKIITPNMLNNNAKANAYLAARGANRLGNNVKLNAARGQTSEWQAILAAATKRTSPGAALPARNLLNGEVSAANEAAKLAAATNRAATIRASMAYRNLTPENLLSVKNVPNNRRMEFINALNSKIRNKTLNNNNMKNKLQKVKNKLSGIVSTGIVKNLGVGRVRAVAAELAGRTIGKN